MYLNRISNNLVILVLSYNRLEKIKRCLKSISLGTKISHEIIVIDGGSTDGSVEYLKQQTGITPVFQNKLIGPIKSLNQVWKNVNCKYLTWIDDDNEINPGSLDKAVKILQKDANIGAVGLKMKDIVGPWINRPYKGGIDAHHIMPFQHCVISKDLLHDLGYANEKYHFYMWNNDLTLSILCSGKIVVHLKKTAIFHDRGYINNKSTIKDVSNYQHEKKMHIDAEKYKKNFSVLFKSTKWKVNYIKRFINSRLVRKILFPHNDSTIFELNSEDLYCYLNARFINYKDFIGNKDYHLAQRIPNHLLASDLNPYKKLFLYNKLG